MNNGTNRDRPAAAENANANAMRQFRYLLHFGQRRRCTGSQAFPLQNGNAKCNWFQLLVALLLLLPLPLPLPLPQRLRLCVSLFVLLLSISAQHFTQLTRFCFCLFWCQSRCTPRSWVAWKGACIGCLGWALAQQWSKRIAVVASPVEWRHPFSSWHLAKIVWLLQPKMWIAEGWTGRLWLL